MWIESHQELRNHPKVKHLASLLGCAKVQAIGHLHMLWWWAVDYARDGYVGKYPDVAIADGAEWAGDASAFVAALREARWMDPDGKLHDWEQYAGRLIEQRERNRRRMAERRAKVKANTTETCSPNVQRTTETRPDTVHDNQTGPDLTKQDHRSPPGDPPLSERPKRMRKSKDIALDVLKEQTGLDKAQNDPQVESWVAYYMRRHPRPGATKLELAEIASKARSEFSALKAAGATDEQMHLAIDEAPAAAMPFHVSQTYRRLFGSSAPARAAPFPDAPINLKRPVEEASA